MHLSPCARLVTCVIAIQVAAISADKKVEPVRAVNDAVQLTATAHIGRDAAKALLGVDPGVDLITVEVKLEPRGESAVTVSRDDFTLISRRDGQKTQALHPSQIAGSTVLMVNSTGVGGGGAMIGQRRGPIWGGVPGTGDRPRRIGGDEDAAVATSPAGAESKVAKNSGDDNPVLAVLKQKELPTGKIEAPATGYLYFLLEDKHKRKDLDLIYKGQGGTLILDFEK